MYHTSKIASYCYFAMASLRQLRFISNVSIFIEKRSFLNPSIGMGLRKIVVQNVKIISK